ncbi:LuxR C-terminal-related transcriptional regulator [Entomohabitans teleogrylli]|uniref:LuxR C-terminal-related transcriptional regulator n=1 Tax=Entomohabitans teleogrylli TaxID=1384589 RepID=UPI00073D58E5|nr:LuxR C-terminal-related transcriptional regulator [Entomohabitans teleogrylli]
MESHPVIWPNHNLFLEIGFTSLLKNRFCNHQFNEVIFVDFSIYNIKLFTNDEWITFLEKTAMRIVLIYDKHMEALANYWLRVSLRITRAIAIRDSYRFLSIEHSRDYWRPSGKKKLTETELLILDLFLAGNSVRDISYRLDFNEKRIYTLQYSLEKKLGIRMKAILTI